LGIDFSGYKYFSGSLKKGLKDSFFKKGFSYAWKGVTYKGRGAFQKEVYTGVSGNKYCFSKL
jgi:hypothetical protein